MLSDGRELARRRLAAAEAPIATSRRGSADMRGHLRVIGAVPSNANPLEVSDAKSTSDHREAGSPGPRAGLRLVRRAPGWLPRPPQAPGPACTVTVPVHTGEILKPKTLASILDQAGIELVEFAKMV